jgi:geranylgeranyl pyrophosphate synthase
VQDVLLACGAVEAVEEGVDRLLREALDALDSARLADPAREALGELARFVAGRDR